MSRCVPSWCHVTEFSGLRGQLVAPQVPDLWSIWVWPSPRGWWQSPREQTVTLSRERAPDDRVTQNILLRSLGVMHTQGGHGWVLWLDGARMGVREGCSTGAGQIERALPLQRKRWPPGGPALAGRS